LKYNVFLYFSLLIYRHYSAAQSMPPSKGVALGYINIALSRLSNYLYDQQALLTGLALSHQPNSKMYWIHSMTIFKSGHILAILSMHQDILPENLTTWLPL